jgi:hypothetical protein
MWKEEKPRERRFWDAMRVGSTEGMQHFDAEIEKFVRDGIIDLDWLTPPIQETCGSNWLISEEKRKHTLRERSR